MADNGGGGRLGAGLWLIATPIGTARDITLRALDVLAAADVLAAEDTRSLRRLLDIHGVALRGRHIISYHDHSDAHARERLLAPARAGKSVAYASEAGTPLIADPGYRLVQAAVVEGLPVSAAPGPSALITALTLAGLPTDRFLFAGFPPARASERRSWLADLAGIRATLVLYESPKRIRATLVDCAAVLGEARQAALCRELTKRFEEVRRGDLAGLASTMGEDDPKGEIVLVIDGHAGPTADPGRLRQELRAALRSMSVRDAAEAVASALAMPRREVYQEALRLAAEHSR